MKYNTIDNQLQRRPVPGGLQSVAILFTDGSVFLTIIKFWSESWTHPRCTFAQNKTPLAIKSWPDDQLLDLALALQALNVPYGLPQRHEARLKPLMEETHTEPKKDLLEAIGEWRQRLLIWNEDFESSMPKKNPSLLADWDGT